MSRFSNLADKPKDAIRGSRFAESTEVRKPFTIASDATTPIPRSRVGRKAISAYFSPEMSLAMHVCARKHGRSCCRRRRGGRGLAEGRAQNARNRGF